MWAANTGGVRQSRSLCAAKRCSCALQSPQHPNTCAVDELVSMIANRPCTGLHRPRPAIHSRRFNVSRTVPCVRAAGDATAGSQSIAVISAPEGPGNLSALKDPPGEWSRPLPRTYTEPSVRSSGTLRPDAEWYPAWMRYRSRDENYVFWTDKFMRCSMDIPVAEKRWTVFSTFWWTFLQLKYYGIPAALRFFFYLLWRDVQQKLYEVHKAFVLWQAKLDASIAAQANQRIAQQQQQQSGSIQNDQQQQQQDQLPPAGLSKAMALRRLHWKNSLVGELLYYINIAKTGRLHMLPPPRRPLQRPTFFWLF